MDVDKIAEIIPVSIPYWVKGDLEGYCKLVKKIYPYDPSTKICLTEYAYMRGDRARCPDYNGNIGWQEYCKTSADLHKAVREKNPEIVRATAYAPIIDKNASCAFLAKRVMAEYATRVGMGLGSNPVEPPTDRFIYPPRPYERSTPE